MYARHMNQLDFRPRKVLAVGAHPDDIDFGASGSIATWVQQGAQVDYLVITDGSKGTADLSLTPEMLVTCRRDEQRAAADTLGVREVYFLNYEDGKLTVTEDLKRDIVRVIRQTKPDTVIVMDPTMVYSEQLGFVNHPDHRAAGQATLDAVYPFARDHLSFPELYTEEKLKPHKVAHLLLVNLDRQNCLIDITQTFDMKLNALQLHESQMPDFVAVKNMVTARAQQLGEKAGCTYAEGFVRLDIT